MSRKKIVILVPYCPLPADTGGKMEMMKHLNVLRDLGDCTILSANRRPVGAGWDDENTRKMRDLGFNVVLRDTLMNPLQSAGMAYASVCKALGLEKAFGHSNPYHRYAFPLSWWRKHTEGADLVVTNYSYWSWLPANCPKACVLLDLWSNYMWEGTKREAKDLGECDRVFVISRSEEDQLRAMGVTQSFWTPPAIPEEEFPVTGEIGLVGSNSIFNREGLAWLGSADAVEPKIRVYGKLAAAADAPLFTKVGTYSDNNQPYRECGIVLFTTVMGMGVQIKTIEALAGGRAIIARRGAVRGLPLEPKGWIEVDTPQEMISAARKLRDDEGLRNRQSAAAREYYRRNLDSAKILASLRQEYEKLLKNA
ncbi:MAG: glycosyltransferase [Kiritimatiellia bacterium]